MFHHLLVVERFCYTLHHASASYALGKIRRYTFMPADVITCSLPEISLKGRSESFNLVNKKQKYHN